MANHCIEVICLNCGKWWCVRGCNFDTTLDKEHLKKARAKESDFKKGQTKAWADVNRCACGTAYIVHA